jgi:hypothetical protein
MVKALSLQEFLNKVKPAQDSSWDLLVKYINDSLVQNNGRVSISKKTVDHIVGMQLGKEFYERIQNEFRQNGWKVTHESGYDPRDQEGWDYITINK